MASIAREPNGRRRILFVAADGRRKTIRLGKVPQRAAEAIKTRVEALLASSMSGCPWDAETARWVADLQDDLAAKLRDIVRNESALAGLPEPTIAVEPGRAIAGPGTVTLYEVGTIKDVAVDNNLTRRYVSVDGGMSDNIRTSLYQADYEARLVSRVSEGEPVVARIVGKHCESGDIVVRDTWIPDDVDAGDLVAVAATGAYCYSMSSRYNLLARPAVVAVRDGRTRVILRRETVEDLLSLEAQQ